MSTKIRKENGLLIDENNNKASIGYWGSEEKARKSLESLENCENCINCSYCRSCSSCSYCSDCSYCRSCSSCSYCSDCSDCSYCSYCRSCSYCSYCSDKEGDFKPIIPQVENLNKKVYEAVQKKDALDMDSWHCGTSHCWAGWIVHLAGEEGYKLEQQTDTPFAAMQIYKKSNGKSINPCFFYLKNEEAMEKIKQMAGE